MNNFFMMIYGIEDYAKKKKKNWIIVVSIAIFVIGMSIFCGIKMAEYIANQSWQKLSENDKNNQEKNESNGNADNEQIKNGTNSTTVIQGRTKW